MRLRAFRPDGFTAGDLSQSASVVLEAARDLLKSFEGQYVEVVGVRPSPSGRGRPSNVYVVTADGYELLSGEITHARRRHFKLSEAGDIYRSLRNLEQTLSDIEDVNQNERADLVAEADREVESCREDLRSLRALGSDLESRFNLRLSLLENRLSSFRGMDEELVDVRTTLERYGRYLDRSTSADEPMLLLLDGIEGEDRLSKKVIQQSRKQHLPVVEFNIAEMEPLRRQELYRKIVFLRESTNLIGCEIVITVNSRTDIGKAVVDEIRREPYLGSWNHNEWPAYVRADARSLRQRFLARAAALIVNSEPKIRDFAIRCTAALSALEATYVSVSEDDARIFRDGFIVSRDPLSGVHQYMGGVMCLDQSYTKDAETAFGNSLVTYKPSIQRHAKVL